MTKTERAVPNTKAPTAIDHGEIDVLATYARATHLLERLHRRLHDIVKAEFDGRGYEAITASQALMIFNIGDQELAARELRARGYYLGSNVTHNLKKLVEGGYVSSRPSEVDRRTVRICLTKRGRAVREIVLELFAKQARGILHKADLDANQLWHLTQSLAKIDRFWSEDMYDV